MSVDPPEARTRRRQAVSGLRGQGGTRRRFSVLARAADPPFDSLLLALAEEFHDVDRAAVLERLDELARPLFGVSGQSPRAAGEVIAAKLGEAAPLRPAAGSVDDLFLDRVLRNRRGHRALLAAIYVELARRAGASLCLLSSGDAWFAGILCDDEAVLLDPARTGDTPQAQLMLRRHCAHELAESRAASQAPWPGLSLSLLPDHSHAPKRPKGRNPYE